MASLSEHATVTTAELRGELFGVHVPELQLTADEYRGGLRAAGLSAGERYLELGSGHGIGVVMAAKEFGARATGVEYLDDAIELTRQRAERAGVDVDVQHNDLRRIDPAPFDVIHMHLGPAFHDVLAARLEHLLLPATRVIAAGWRVPGWLPVEGALEQWDGGYVYRPADPRMHGTWGDDILTLTRCDGSELHCVEFVAHADLWDIEPRINGIPASDVIALDRHWAGRGTTLLVELPDAAQHGELTLWARCRAGRITQRGESRGQRAA